MEVRRQYLKKLFSLYQLANEVDRFDNYLNDMGLMKTGDLRDFSQADVKDLQKLSCLDLELSVRHPFGRKWTLITLKDPMEPNGPDDVRNQLETRFPTGAGTNGTRPILDEPLRDQVNSVLGVGQANVAVAVRHAFRLSLWVHLLCQGCNVQRRSLDSGLVLMPYGRDGAVLLVAGFSSGLTKKFDCSLISIFAGLLGFRGFDVVPLHDYNPSAVLAMHQLRRLPIQLPHFGDGDFCPSQNSGPFIRRGKRRQSFHSEIGSPKRLNHDEVDLNFWRNPPKIGSIKCKAQIETRFSPLNVTVRFANNTSSKQLMAKGPKGSVLAGIRRIYLNGGFERAGRRRDLNETVWPRLIRCGRNEVGLVVGGVDRVSFDVLD